MVKNWASCYSWYSQYRLLGPCFLANHNGPYKQYGPISDDSLEEGHKEEVKGLIPMEMWNILLQPKIFGENLEGPSGAEVVCLLTENNLKLFRISQFNLIMIEISCPITSFWPCNQSNFSNWKLGLCNIGPITRWPYNRYWLYLIFTRTLCCNSLKLESTNEEGEPMFQIRE